MPSLISNVFVNKNITKDSFIDDKRQSFGKKASNEDYYDPETAAQIALWVTTMVDKSDDHSSDKEEYSNRIATILTYWGTILLAMQRELS
jgi:hypothetical protein